MLFQSFGQIMKATRSPRVSPLSWADTMALEDAKSESGTPDQTGMD